MILSPEHNVLFNIYLLFITLKHHMMGKVQEADDVRKTTAM